MVFNQLVAVNACLMLTLISVDEIAKIDLVTHPACSGGIG